MFLCLVRREPVQLVSLFGEDCMVHYSGQKYRGARSPPDFYFFTERDTPEHFKGGVYLNIHGQAIGFHSSRKLEDAPENLESALPVSELKKELCLVSSRQLCEKLGITNLRVS
jgi:hypothetical protein